MTDEELKAAVDKAVADARTADADKIRQLEDQLSQHNASNATATAVTEATKPLQDQIDELTARVDTEQQARAAAEAERDSLKAWFSDLAETENNSKLRGERIEAVKQTGAFPAGSLDDAEDPVNVRRFDRWAAMDADEFESYLTDDLKARVAPATDKKDEGVNGILPDKRSAVTDAAEGGAGGDTKPATSRFMAGLVGSSATAKTN